MQRLKWGNIEWLAFEHLSTFKNLTHAVFLKTLDFSTPEASAFAKEALKLPTLFSSNQCHGKEVVEITQTVMERPSCDAFITQEREVGLLIKHADCQAAIFYDPEHKALATIHAGWRGSSQNIYRATIEKMKERYGTNPAALLVGISPSLGPQAAEFRHYETELPEHFWRFQVKPTYFDFWQISRYQLEELGVLAPHIEIAQMCTYSMPEDFFSYRRGDKTSGRHATVAALR